MIDKQPLDLFGGDDQDETQPPDPVAADPASEPGAEPGFWLCQWCAAKIPFGASNCPECNGSLGDHGQALDPESELLRFFTKRSPIETLANFYIEGVTHLGGVADQRETYQEYFRESLRRQAAEATLSPMPAEEPPLACRWCNTAHDEGQTFCANCGTRLPPRAGTNAPEAPVKCQWCQASIEPGTAVCPACNGTIDDPGRTVSGLTDLTTVEKAAEYAFQQAPPIRGVQIGIGADLYRVNRLRKSLFGKRE